MRFIKFSFVIVLNFVFTLQSIGQTWNIVTIGDGQKPGITVDSRDRIHIAHINEDFNGWVSYVLVDGSETNSEVAQEGNFYGPTAICVDADDNPLIAYHDHDSQNETVLQGGEFWRREEVMNNNHDGWDNDIVVDASGNVHTSSVDGAAGVEYAFRASGSAWSKETLPTERFTYRYSTGIDVDNSGDPHIAYYDPDPESLHLASKNGSSWNIETIDTEGGIWPDMAADASGNMHIVYGQELSSTSAIIKVAHESNGSWNIEVVDTLVNLDATARHVTSIAIDGNNIIHISYGDRTFIKYGQRINNTWEIEVAHQDDGNPGILGSLTNLALNSSGDPYIVFYEVPGTVKYVWKSEPDNPNDQDNDGFNSDVDCDDNNAAIHPDATEIANNDIDENCDGEILIIDVDQDGFISDEDCNDDDADINPDATEIANNNVDENCDGEILIIDVDQDGFNSDEDCNDDDADINPDATEIANNSIDENCDGELLIIDTDNDGYNSDEDCDDSDANINPDATEILDNNVDENCDGIIGVSNSSSISGTILNSKGEGIANVWVVPNTSSIDSVQTDQDGFWTIESADANYEVTYKKPDAALNGVSSSDILLIQNHILQNRVFTEEFEFVAADANQDEKISVADLVTILNVLIGRDQTFPEDASWIFNPSSSTIEATTEQIDGVVGIKVGDPNASADPKSP